MLSLQSYFDNSQTFSRLFVESAAELQKSAKVLLELFNCRSNPPENDVFFPMRLRSQQLEEEIDTLLYQSWVTPLEREDLEALSHALSRIQKAMEKFSTRIFISKSYLPDDYLDLSTKMLREATNVVCEMVEQLWHQPALAQIKKENDRLQTLESDVDRLVVTMLNEFYQGESETMQVVVFRDLSGLFEKFMDQCREAGKVIFHMVLKNS